MDCNEVRELLPAHADRELGVRESIEVEQHVKRCAACLAEYAQQTAVSAAIKQHAAYRGAPSHLERRILAGLPDEPVLAARAPRPRWTWLNLGGAMAMALALVWSVGLWLALPTASDRLADEVVASHVRALMSNRLADVASSDQHTVKPWFNGKLDFAPTVSDFAEQGFPLIGGRLDYVNQRPVATLVYQHRKHPINVYIWPARGPGQGEARSVTHALSRQGYHLAHWTTTQGMTYWVVSDLDEQELAALVRLLREQ